MAPEVHGAGSAADGARTTSARVRTKVPTPGGVSSSRSLSSTGDAGTSVAVRGVRREGVVPVPVRSRSLPYVSYCRSMGLLLARRVTSVIELFTICTGLFTIYTSLYTMRARRGCRGRGAVDVGRSSCCLDGGWSASVPWSWGCRGTSATPGRRGCPCGRQNEGGQSDAARPLHYFNSSMNAAGRSTLKLKD